MFYGWYIAAAGIILMGYNAWAVIYGFTAFINPIARTFGWSYAQISLAMSLRGVETGALNPLLGMAVDRWPSKRLALMGIILFGLGLFTLSQVTNLAMFYISFLLMGLGSSLAIQMIPPTAVARWFRRDLGKASGILAMGPGLGGALLPLLVKIVDSYGWQTSLILVAAGLWVLGIPLSFVFRNRPEDYGLLPDGKPPVDSTGSSDSDIPDFSAGVKEVFKMRAFWYISIASMFQVAGINAVLVYMMPYLVSLGMERTSASLVAMLVPLASLAARIPSGFMADIFAKKHVLAISVGLTSIGLFFFWLIDGTSFGLKLLFAITFGFGIGSSTALRPVILREYFGAKKFGTILGLTSIFITFGIVVAPPAVGWVFDTLGVYGPVWLILSGISMAGAILMLATPPASRNLHPA